MTTKHLPTALNRFAIVFTVAFSIFLAACNSDEETAVTDTYLASESVAVTNFSLTADLRVMKNLDSVFFSIDLDHGVIFNADSLPKGTNVTKLIPKISYPTSVKSAIIEMTGGTHREGTVDYFKNANDTIDFTGDVKLTLSTENNRISKTYTLKVNVHREEPDTLYWDRMASMSLPSRLPEPEQQKSVNSDERVISLIRESDGSLTLSSTDDIFESVWQKSVFSPGFEPDIHSLTWSPEGTLFLRSGDGALYASGDEGETWNVASNGWDNLIGMFGNTLLGTRMNSDYTQTLLSYPEGSYPEMTMPEGFPIDFFSNPIEFDNRWSSEPTIIIFGGYPTGEEAGSWAFDGSQWVNIAETPLPALEGLSVVPYYSYLKSASNSQIKEFEVYLAFGGRDYNNEINRTVYVSYDHGINWQKAQKYMQLPEEIAVGTDLNAIAIGYGMHANLGDFWKKSGKRKLPFEVDEDTIFWECPYIFLFGGYDFRENLIPEIRCGVLQRLTFTPLF